MRSCFVGGHVLWEVMSYRSACIQDGISYRMIFLRGRHILQEDRSYWCVCIIGGHALLKDMSYRSTYIIRGHVLLKIMFLSRICPT